MFNLLREKLKGKKTYILSCLGILVALIGHYAGPFKIGDIQIPQFTWSEVWLIVWNGGLFTTTRAGIYGLKGASPEAGGQQKT